MSEATAQPFVHAVDSFDDEEEAPISRAPQSRAPISIAPGAAPPSQTRLSDEPTLGMPFFFGPTQGLFGVYHAPLAAKRSGGIVLCHPIGDEFSTTHAAFVRLAERLALAGFPVLRFHYHGTGDSTGQDTDAGRVAAWTASVQEAIAALRAHGNVDDVSLFGIRTGALLGAAAVTEMEGISSMALFAPAVNGKAWVRELRAFRSLHPDKEVSNPRQVAEGEEAAGFLLTPETIADISKINLTKMKPAAKRYLIIGRDDFPGEDPYVQKLREAGCDAKYIEPEGYKALMTTPHFTVVPVKIWDAVAEFFMEVHPPRRGPPTSRRGETRGTGIGTVRRDSSSALLREEAVRFGPDENQFAIVTQLEAAPKKPHVGVILITSGEHAHFGPYRAYVPLARHLAEEGFLALRLDLESVGESRVFTSEGTEPYSPRMVECVRAAMDVASRKYGVNKFVLYGVCSGGYHAFHTALADKRAVGSILINTQTFSWREGDGLDIKRHRNFTEANYYKRRAFSPEAWKKLLRGGVNVRHVYETVSTRVVTLARTKLNELQKALKPKRGDESTVISGVRALIARKNSTLLVYTSPEDPGVDYIKLHGGRPLEKLQDAKHFQIQYLEGGDATFMPIWRQRRIHEIVVDHMKSRFGAA